MLYLYLDPMDFVSDENNVFTFTLNNFKESVCINITIEDDNVLEDKEYFELSLFSPDPRVIFKEQVSTVCIVDNDCEYIQHYTTRIHAYNYVVCMIDVTVELSNSSFTVSEEQGWVTVCILLSGSIDRFVEVEIFSVDGDAKGMQQFHVCQLNHKGFTST